MGSLVCQKCGKLMKDTEFYQYRDGGKTELCKKCLTMHIDNFNPDTFLWALEKMDVPYVEGEWNSLRDKAYARDPYKMNGMSVFGKYLAKMRLMKWKDKRWSDTEQLQAEEAERKRAQEEEIKKYEEEVTAKYKAGEISEAQYLTLTSTVKQHEEQQKLPVMPEVLQIEKRKQAAIGQNNAFNEDNFISEEEIDIAADLTQEDKLYLAMKWGRTYPAQDWVIMEKNYKDMMDSFEIEDADSMNTLILLCKANLKTNQAMDQGDMDGALKYSKIADSLRKSAKWTAAQNKKDKTDVVDSVGCLVEFCEKEGGFIPRFDTSSPRDEIDFAIQNMNGFTQDFVKQDPALAQEIENYLKKREIAEQQRLELQEKKLGIFKAINEGDIDEFSASLAKQKAEDDRAQKGDVKK